MYYGPHRGKIINIPNPNRADRQIRPCTFPSMLYACGVYVSAETLRTGSRDRKSSQMKNSFSIVLWWWNVGKLQCFYMMKLREMINAETIFHSFKMQYSLLHSSSIVLHFSFYRTKLFQLEWKLYIFKVFLSKKNGRHFKVIKVTPTNFIFFSLIWLILDVPWVWSM